MSLRTTSTFKRIYIYTVSECVKGVRALIYMYDIRSDTGDNDLKRLYEFETWSRIEREKHLSFINNYTARELYISILNIYKIA
jgi:hypothetical protein